MLCLETIAKHVKGNILLLKMKLIFLLLHTQLLFLSSKKAGREWKFMSMGKEKTLFHVFMLCWKKIRNKNNNNKKIIMSTAEKKKIETNFIWLYLSYCCLCYKSNTHFQNVPWWVKAGPGKGGKRSCRVQEMVNNSSFLNHPETLIEDFIKIIF